jgi:hypothetical protein
MEGQQVEHGLPVECGSCPWAWKGVIEEGRASEVLNHHSYRSQQVVREARGVWRDPVEGCGRRPGSGHRGWGVGGGVRARTWRWMSTKGRRDMRGAACKCPDRRRSCAFRQRLIWSGWVRRAVSRGRLVTQGELESKRCDAGGPGGSGLGLGVWLVLLQAQGGACRGGGCTLLSAWSQRGGLAAVSRRT